MKKFLEEPAVRAALDALQTALNAVQGVEMKNLLVVAETTDLKTGVYYSGCDCPFCALRMIKAATRPFGGHTEVVGVDPAAAIDAAGRVH
jgi:hypothetical protein